MEEIVTNIGQNIFAVTDILGFSSWVSACNTRNRFGTRLHIQLHYHKCRY